MRRTALPLFGMLAFAGLAPAQVFTPGNLAVLRLGDGTGTLSGASAPVFIEQYTTGGVPVGTPLAVPSTGANALSNSGTATSEGFLTLSSNGQFLFFGSYNAPAGTAAIAGTASSAFQRAAVRVDAQGNVAPSLLGMTAFSAGNPRSAFSTDGTNIWVGGSNGGVQYQTFGSGTTTGALSSSPTNVRVVNVINSQLYTSSSSGAFQGPATIGTGLPTTTGQTTTLLPGFPTTAGPSPYQYVGFNNPLNPNSFNGIDTLYVADDRTFASGGGIQRWVFDGTNWALSTTVSPDTVGLRGLTASIVGNTVTLFGVTAETSLNRLVSVTDMLTAGGGTFGTFSTLATAPANEIFRGVSFTPSPIPEPTSLLLGGLAAAGFGWIRRRQRGAQ